MCVSCREAGRRARGAKRLYNSISGTAAAVPQRRRPAGPGALAWPVCVQIGERSRGLQLCSVATSGMNNRRSIKSANVHARGRRGTRSSAGRVWRRKGGRGGGAKGVSTAVQRRRRRVRRRQRRTAARRWLQFRSDTAGGVLCYHIRRWRRALPQWVPPATRAAPQQPTPRRRARAGREALAWPHRSRPRCT